MAFFSLWQELHSKPSYVRRGEHLLEAIGACDLSGITTCQQTGGSTSPRHCCCQAGKGGKEKGSMQIESYVWHPYQPWLTRDHAALTHSTSWKPRRNSLPLLGVWAVCVFVCDTGYFWRCNELIIHNLNHQESHFLCPWGHYFLWSYTAQSAHLEMAMLVLLWVFVSMKEEELDLRKT